MSRSDLTEFEAHRADLLALAYRMLGDVARAEDLVQEAWIRWSGRAGAVESPRAYLVTVMTRLCLNELASAPCRREESRSDRLPEPVALDAGGLTRVESLEQVSMAFMVALQRLTATERAVLLLHDVFEFEHAEIGVLLGKSDSACRKLLERAKQSIAEQKRSFTVSREAHERLLSAFVSAAFAGDVAALASIFAEDAVMITDGGARGRVVDGFRTPDAPIAGAERVAAFVVAATRRGSVFLVPEVVELNGLPALVLRGPNGTFAAITLAVDEQRIHRVYFHADPDRLAHLERLRQ